MLPFKVDYTTESGRRTYQQLERLDSVRSFLEANTHDKAKAEIYYLHEGDWVEVWSEADDNCAWPTEDLQHVVILTYFKASGKYYTHGGYLTALTHWFKVIEEVGDMHTGTAPMPGLSSNGSEFHVLVRVPTMVATDVPHLIMRTPDAYREVPKNHA